MQVKSKQTTYTPFDRIESLWNFVLGLWLRLFAERLTLLEIQGIKTLDDAVPRPGIKLWQICGDWHSIWLGGGDSFPSVFD